MSQSVVDLYIYKMGRYCPARKSFTSLNLSGLLVSVRTGGHQSHRWGAPVRPVHSMCKTCISHISLIRTPIWTFHIWILIFTRRDLSNGEVQIVFYGLWTHRSDRWDPQVWPVETRRANFWCEQIGKPTGWKDLYWTFKFIVLRMTLDL
jgi:hypothetical protein